MKHFISPNSRDRANHTGTQAIGTVDGLQEALPIPAVSVINDGPRITINSLTPVVIMTASITLPRPAKLEIAGAISGPFVYVSGVACYVNGTAINTGTGNNRCHPDCFLTTYESNSGSHLTMQAYHTVSDELPAGDHQIEIAHLSAWEGRARETYVNNRLSSNMASSSSLVVRPL